MSGRWYSEAFKLPMHYTAVFSESDFHAALDEMGEPKEGRPAWIKNSHSHATVHSFRDADGLESAVVALRKKPGITGIQIAGLLTHEAVHIFQWCCESWGEDSPSKEFQAYGIQQISQNLMQQYVEYLEGES